MNDDNIYIIEWLDHIAIASWLDTELIKKQKPALIRTIGFLVEENNEYIKLVDTITEDGDMGGLSLIIKSCIINIWHLKVK